MGITYEEILEWQDTAEKFVKAYTDNTWNVSYDNENDLIYSETSVHAYSSLIGAEENKRAQYTYKISVDLGSRSSDITFTDIIENEPGTVWNGTLNSIDFTEVLVKLFGLTLRYGIDFKVNTFVHEMGGEITVAFKYRGKEVAKPFDVDMLCNMEKDYVLNWLEETLQKIDVEMQEKTNE